MSTLTKMVGSDFDVDKIRADFPVLRQTIHGKPLVYLDNAATAQKPLRGDRSHPPVPRGGLRQHPPRRSRAEPALHRGVRRDARQGEALPERPQQERAHLRARHHRGHQPGGAARGDARTSRRATRSSSRPWSITPTSCPGRCCARRKSAKLRVIPMNDRGELILEEYEKLLNPRTRMVAFCHVSNALGTINPVRGDDRDGAPRGRPGAGRRRAGGAAHEGGRAGARRRFLRLLRATRCSGRPASASCTARRSC